MKIGKYQIEIFNKLLPSENKNVCCYLCKKSGIDLLHIATTEPLLYPRNHFQVCGECMFHRRASE